MGELFCAGYNLLLFFKKTPISLSCSGPEMEEIYSVLLPLWQKLFSVGWCHKIPARNIKVKDFLRSVLLSSTCFGCYTFIMCASWIRFIQIWVSKWSAAHVLDYVSTVNSGWPGRLFWPNTIHGNITLVTIYNFFKLRESAPSVAYTTYSVSQVVCSGWSYPQPTPIQLCDWYSKGTGSKWFPSAPPRQPYLTTYQTMQSWPHVVFLLMCAPNSTNWQFYQYVRSSKSKNF